MKRSKVLWMVCGPLFTAALILGSASSHGAKEKGKEPASSYAPVVVKEDFAATMSRMKAEKPKVMARHMELLKARYDLSDPPAKGATMTKGKPLQEGVRAKLGKDLTWEKLGAMTPEDIREKGL